MSKTIKLVLFVLIVSLISFSCKNNNSSKNKTAINSSTSQTIPHGKQEVTSKITVLTPAEFKEKSKNKQILDVRTPFEFSQGYIKEAKNINFFDKNFLKEVNSFDKSKPIYVYCKSGHRSGIAVKQMAKSGFKEIYELKNGIINWVRNNNEIEK